MHQFKYHQGALHCEEVNLQTLAQDYGTPLYVYSSQTLRNNYKRLHEALGNLDHHIAFAVKANSNLSVLRLLAELGSGFDIVSGGTDNHLLLIDLRNKSITGRDAENSLGKAGITVNKNMVPYDDQSPFVTSGIRIGTPAITTRGLKEEDMGFVAESINCLLYTSPSPRDRQKSRMPSSA